MKTETFEFIGCHGAKLPAMLWLPDHPPKVILQITHGMTEHIGRYTHFARDMTAQGIAVAGFDLRGHGNNPGDPDVASFGPGGWDAAIEDMKYFYDLLEKRFSGIPHYLHGFSLGSFLLREYLGIYPDCAAGAIIMGSGYQTAFVLFAISTIIKGQCKKVGFNKTSNLVKTLSFGAYNQKFKPNRTTADWLCSDQEQLDKYLSDPLVRRDISSGLFWQLLGAMRRTGRKTSCNHWNQELPVLLICGANDPVGNMGRGAEVIKKLLEESGIQNISYHLIPEARHMLLNEEASGAAASTRHIISRWLLQ